MTGLPYRGAVSHGRAKRPIRETLTHTEWANELHPQAQGLQQGRQGVLGTGVCSGGVEVAAGTRREKWNYELLHWPSAWPAF